MRLRTIAPAGAIALASAVVLSQAAFAARPPIAWEVVGSYNTGLVSAADIAAGAETAAETSAFERGWLYVTNSTDKSLDIVDARDPSQPIRTARIALGGGGPNSVDVDRGLVAVAVEADPKTDKGWVAFFDRDGDTLGTVQVGALPDMVTFTPDGRYVVVANEGEPNSYGQGGSVDPVGSISLVPTRQFRRAIERGGPVTGVESSTIGFADFNVGGARRSELPDGVRLNGPDASVAQDLEPEYITVSKDGDTAWVTLQEANSIAIVDLRRERVDAIVPLGTKNHDLPVNALDPSDRDSCACIATWPVRGLYMPDGIASAKVRGKTYLVTANEGDGRDYTGFGDEVRVGSGAVTLDPTVFPNAATLKQNANLGRLTISKTDGVVDGKYVALYSFGARSMSVWTTDGKLVGDTGKQMEQLVKDTTTAVFNTSNNNNTFDDRSDNKGPEPEGIATGVIRGVPYAFVGLERAGGFMTVDLRDPSSPTIVDWANNRDYAASPVGPDTGPEIIRFVDGDDVRGGRPMVIVANEITGTVTFYRLVRGSDD